MNRHPVSLRCSQTCILMVFNAISRQISNYWLCAIFRVSFCLCFFYAFPTILQRYSFVGRLAILRMRWRNLVLLGIYGVPGSQSSRVPECIKVSQRPRLGQTRLSCRPKRCRPWEVGTYIAPHRIFES